jgi:DNA-nicking Smr family endonuclease
VTKSASDGPRRRHGLTAEDRALWDHVVSSVNPLTSQPRATEAPTTAPPAAAPAAGMPAVPVTKSARPAPVPPATASRPKKVEPPEIGTLERRKKRQIATGRLSIDARIDLHGMTQDRAHAVLRSFIYGCAARGDRLVLVITGKGGTTRQEEDGWSVFERRDRGVLRRNVPRWLAEPDLAQLVIDVAPANARHGGDGALYVRLRVRRT